MIKTLKANFVRMTRTKLDYSHPWQQFTPTLAPLQCSLLSALIIRRFLFPNVASRSIFSHHEQTQTLEIVASTIVTLCGRGQQFKLSRLALKMFRKSFIVLRRRHHHGSGYFEASPCERDYFSSSVKVSDRFSPIFIKYS